MLTKAEHAERIKLHKLWTRMQITLKQVIRCTELDKKYEASRPKR